jgi:hypothetical protein
MIVPKRTFIQTVLCVAALLAVASFKYASEGGLVIRFQNVVGNRVLHLDSTYRNELGQVYTITNFKYYIGKISFKKADGKEYACKEFYLISESDTASKEIKLPHIPPGEYVSMSFLIGVDSLHNCSGAQSGALDPVNGMFWTWNSGYVFLKLEGKSPSSASPGNLLEFHIGGYRQPHNCIREVSLNLGKEGTIKGETSSRIEIKADAGELFKTPVTIDFSKLSSVNDFHNATLLATNYSDMFSIKQTEHEK